MQDGDINDNVLEAFSMAVAMSVVNPPNVGDRLLGEHFLTNVAGVKKGLRRDPMLTPDEVGTVERLLERLEEHISDLRASWAQLESNWILDQVFDDSDDDAS